MESIQLLLSLQQDIIQIKKAVLSPLANTIVSDKWVPRSDVMKFFNYGSTQMAAFEKCDGLIVAKIGKRKFIHRDSIARLLDNNIIKP